MDRAYKIAATSFLAFSAAVIWGALNLEYYTKLGPGAGFFPFWLGVAMAALSLAWLVQVCAAKRAQDAPFLPDRAGIARIAAIVGSLTVAAALMNLLGYQVVMFLLLAFLLLVLGRQPVWLTAIVALAGSAGVYRIFVAYLDVPLPAATVALLTRLGL